MHDIICPHCGKAFKIDEAGYADILKQVRDSAFEQQLHERLELAEQDKRNAIELARAKSEAELQKAAAARDAEIQELKARLDAGEMAQKMAVAEAMANGKASVTGWPMTWSRPGRKSCPTSNWPRRAWLNSCSRPPARRMPKSRRSKPRWIPSP
jgi:hypothetical protein